MVPNLKSPLMDYLKHKQFVLLEIIWQIGSLSDIWNFEASFRFVQILHHRLKLFINVIFRTPLLKNWFDLDKKFFTLEMHVFEEPNL